MSKRKSAMPVADAVRLIESSGPSLIKKYFGRDGAGKPFSGARFQTLAGGGDRSDVVVTFDANDLVAVQTLSVVVPIEAALSLLEGRWAGPSKGSWPKYLQR